MFEFPIAPALLTPGNSFWAQVHPRYTSGQPTTSTVISDSVTPVVCHALVFRLITMGVIPIDKNAY